MAKAMGATRGDARKFERVFNGTLMPMALIDNSRAHIDVNRSARLLLRLSLAQLRKLHIDDLTPPADIPTLEATWDRFQRLGSVSGLYRSRFADGSELLSVYAAVANVLPGRHLAVFQPADWPEDELGEMDLHGADEPLPGPLSLREREVLTWVAGGYDLQQIADELTIARSTVRTHVRNALRKLHARNRPHGVAVAIYLGLIDLPRPDQGVAGRIA
jgi:DNA-binding CsgD family transcriptional regulator